MMAEWYLKGILLYFLSRLLDAIRLNGLHRLRNYDFRMRSRVNVTGLFIRASSSSRFRRDLGFDENAAWAIGPIYDRDYRVRLLYVTFFTFQVRKKFCAIFVN